MSDSAPIRAMNGLATPWQVARVAGTIAIIIDGVTDLLRHEACGHRVVTLGPPDTAGSLTLSSLNTVVFALAPIIGVPVFIEKGVHTHVDGTSPRFTCRGGILQNAGSAAAPAIPDVGLKVGTLLPAGGELTAVNLTRIETRRCVDFGIGYWSGLRIYDWPCIDALGIEGIGSGSGI